MSRFGLLINYDFCTGCLTCEVACQQEHNYPPGRSGMKVTEYVTKGHKNRVSVVYLPFPTDLCVLCAARTRAGEQPACVKHCQAGCMRYGPISKLAEEMGKRPKMVLFKPR